MAEWSKAHAWKVCNRQKRFMGSNHILSANKKCRREAAFFYYLYPSKKHEFNTACDMKTSIISYISALVSFLAIDAVWLFTMSKRFYGVHLKHLMSESPKFGAAGIFYLLYILGLIVLVVLPALAASRGLLLVFLYGALFGLVSYATYDLTNQATLKDWPMIVTVVDLAWGALLTGLVSVIATAITRHFI